MVMVFECGCGCWISKHVSVAWFSFHLKVQCSFNDRVMQVGKHGETMETSLTFLVLVVDGFGAQFAA